MVNPWMEHLKAFRAANPGMSLSQAMVAARPSYTPVAGAKKRAPKKPAAPKARKSGPRAKLAPALHSCAGLDEDPCMVAPNCYWKPTTKTCSTRSGAQVKQRMEGPKRQMMLAQLRDKTPLYQDGGYWW